jgi:hypothetical protein
MFSMTKQKAGLTKEERATFLREHGWVQARDGKGSHSMWVNPDIKEMARKYKFDLPINLKTSQHQNAWDLPMCENPASGTWANIEKHVLWCDARVQEIASSQQARDMSRTIKHEFNDVRKKFSEWKQETKHRLKAGLSPTAPPVSFDTYQKVFTARRMDLDMRKGGL